MNFVAKSLPAAGVLLLVSVANAQAADMPVKAPPIVQSSPILGWISPILLANNQISLDAIGQNIDYLETVKGPFDTERGWQPGLQLTGSAMGNLGPITNVYVMGQFTWAKDHTHYVGGAGGSPYGSVVGASGAETKDFDFRLGKGFDVGQNWMFTPYFGAGYHVWDRNVTEGMPGGYFEKYEHGYTGGGLLIQWAPTNQWVISANGLVGSTFSPQMTTSMNGAFAAPNTFNLGSKLIWKAGLSTDYALTPQWHLNAGFDYTCFNYGASDWVPIPNRAGHAANEPDSRSGIWTVKTGIGYSFYQPSARY